MAEAHPIFLEILKNRGIVGKNRELFLSPIYENRINDPFLLPDMLKAVERLIIAKNANETVYIYGDYDIDGLTASALLYDAFSKFGLQVKTFIPNRFIEGYGLNEDAIKTIADLGANLIVTVDCGSLSHKEIDLANSLGVDVIVTDHHSLAESMPNAVAVINPKRSDHKYPFIDLAGVGVAFKLVQALQKHIEGLPEGQERWLLDLVAMGTICDVVSLSDENRVNTYWGLRVLRKTRRPGLKALMMVAGLEPSKVTARQVGFVLGPHLNASGRMITAQVSLDLLLTNSKDEALAIAYQLRDINQKRKTEQNRITLEAEERARNSGDSVLVLSDPDWSHGIIGIIAARLLEKYNKPTFILQELGQYSKGSARSFGDFSAVEAIRAVEALLVKGGGHKLAAGITIETSKIPEFRLAINAFYKKLNLKDQRHFLDPRADVTVEDLSDLTIELLEEFATLEPFGHDNPEPILLLPQVEVIDCRALGKEGRHFKLFVRDAKGHSMAFVAFNMSMAIEQGDLVRIWTQLRDNVWRGVRSLEPQIVKVEML